MVLDQVEKILLYILVTYQVAIGSGHLVGTPPSVIGPGDLIVSEVDGDNMRIGFVLTCESGGDPRPAVSWYRGNTLLDPDSNDNLMVTTSSGSTVMSTLEIKIIEVGVDASREGVDYHCLVENTFGIIQSRTAKVSLSYFEEWSVTGPATISALSGGRVAIPCDPPAARPTPVVEWRVDDTKVTASDTDPNADIQILPSGHLVFHSLADGNFAEGYTCYVTNARIYNESMSPQTWTLVKVNDNELLPTEGSLITPDSLHVYYHDDDITAEQGSTVYIRNVVSPLNSSVTLNADILSNLNPAVLYTGGVSTVQSYAMIPVPPAISDAYLRYENAGNDVFGILQTAITVIESATVVSTSDRQRALTGETVILHCDISGIPVPSVEWYKNGVKLTSGDQVTTSSSSSTFTIANAAPSDTGMYQCVATNDHGHDRGSISLSVRDPINEFEIPIPRETAFVEGDNVTLEVAVRSDHRPTSLVWSVNGMDITSSNSTYILGPARGREGGMDDRGLTQYNTTLTVKGINETYSGVYKVVARQSTLESVSMGNVLEEKLVTTVTISLLEEKCLISGQTLTIKCDTDGVPRGTVVWTVPVDLPPDMYEVSDPDALDITLTVKDIIEDYEGTYVCTVSNELRDGTEATVADNDPFTYCEVPTASFVDEDMKDVTVDPGESFTFRCAADGDPLPDIMWFKGPYDGGQQLVTRGKVSIQTNTDTTSIESSLTISNVDVNDGGIYTCRAENDASTSEVTFTANIIVEATVTLTAPSSPPCFGQTYKLTCTHPVLDADTNVRWERNGTGFTPQSTPNHDGDDPTPTTTTLTITVTREEFENTVYTFRCITFDSNLGFNDPNRVISNEVTVDPPDVPLPPVNIGYMRTSNSISIDWQHEDVCFIVVSYEVELLQDGHPTVLTNDTSITIEELVPNTKYAIVIRVVSGTVKSRSVQVMVNTLKATVTLTAQSSPPCFGQTYKLTCTHPVLVTSTLLWERNGVFFSPSSSTTHDEDDPTPTTTSLTITVTREEFENRVYTYRCYTDDQVTNESLRVYSNSIAVDPQCTSESAAVASDCVSWISAFGVVTSLLIISWSIFIATCVVAVCMYKKVHISRKNEKYTPQEVGMERNPAYAPAERSQIEDFM